MKYCSAGRVLFISGSGARKSSADAKLAANKMIPIPNIADTGSRCAQATVHSTLCDNQRPTIYVWPRWARTK